MSLATRLKKGFGAETVYTEREYFTFTLAELKEEVDKMIDFYGPDANITFTGVTNDWGDRDATVEIEIKYKKSKLTLDK